MPVQMLRNTVRVINFATMCMFSEIYHFVYSKNQQKTMNKHEHRWMCNAENCIYTFNQLKQYQIVGKKKKRENGGEVTQRRRDEGAREQRIADNFRNRIRLERKQNFISVQIKIVCKKKWNKRWKESTMK